MFKKLSVLASRVSNFRSVTRRPERPLSVIPPSRVLWFVAFAIGWMMTGYGGIAMGQVGSVDDPLDMADSSGDIKRIEAWVDEGNLHLTMMVYGVFAPSVEDTPAGMTNRYYYHWLLDTDNNPDTGYLNDEYEGNATNLETPIGVDVLVQFGWRDGDTAGVYAYTLDLSTGDEVELFEDYEYTIDGDTIHAVIPLEDLGLELGQTIAVSAFQEGASNGWQCDWIESCELTLEDTTGQVGSVDDPLDMADSSGDIKRIEAWVDEGNLHLTMTVYGVFAPSVEDTPADMTNRYYYHWLLDTDNNPDTGYLNDEYEGNATNLETPIGVDVLVQFGWRDGATNGVYAYTLDPLTGDEVELFEDYEYTIDGDTIHAAIPLEDLGLELGQTIAVSAFQEGASNGWQCDWIESCELTLEDTTVGAYKPNPEDGAILTELWVNLSWSPDKAAVSHDVYFGDNYDDVANGTGDTFRVNQGLTFYIVGFPGYPYPDGLVPGTTYYWRIDEVNEADPRSPWKGDVWSFTIPPKTAYFPDPADGAESVSFDASLSFTPGFGAKLHTVYFGETFDEVDNATGGSTQGITTYTPGILKMARTYYWRVDEFDSLETYKGDVWSFTTEGAVSSPNPAKGAVDVTQTPVLTWAPGLGATHELYFGADPASLELKANGNLGEESYEPGQLEWNTTYYWRVDEANNTNVDSPWTGPLWNFTTANFLVVDDFESYNDLNPDDPNSNRIFLSWLDGLGDSANGSLVGYENPPFAEQKIVHDGSQSMPMFYDNSAAAKSEATLTLTSNRDWTVKGVDTLTIWFRASVGNAAEQMYVTLNGSARVDHSNPDAATKFAWTAWNIELQKFADQGIDLTNVNSITLGLSSVTAGSGMMYFDDIRLLAPTP
jgi:hypothetical protein